MGLSKSQYDEHFNQFIKSLEDRLAHYGLKITPGKRVWQWIKSHKILSTIVTIFIIGITLVGTNWTLVEENVTKFLEFLR